MSVLKKFRKHGDKDNNIGPGIGAPLPTYQGVGGQMRADEFGTPYWLNEEQLRHVAKLNVEIDDDAKFWAEFRKYRVDQGIRASRYGDTGSRKESFSTTKYEFHDPNAKTKGGSLSGWWTGWKSTFGWGSGNETKLALAKRAIEATVNVIDDSGAKMTVEFAAESDQPVSFTDFDRHRIVVTAKPILDGVEDGRAIDIESGLGLHEASHSKYTREIQTAVFQPEPITPVAISHLLMNVLEDVRIEMLTGQEFPGFAKYFDIANEYMWSTGEESKPKTYGPDLLSKINSVIGFCKWPQHFRDEAALADEYKWWRSWLADYIEQRVDVRESITRGIAHLELPTEEEKPKGKGKPGEGPPGPSQGKQEMDEQREREREQGEIEDMIREFIERMGGDLRKSCTHRDVPEGERIHDEEKERIQQRIDEKIQREDEPVVMGVGVSNPPHIITKPLEHADSKRDGKKRHDPLVSKYRHALLFRPAKPRHAVKLTKDGKVDATQLWRWAGDDWRVFQHKEIHDQPQARVYLLVDVSGSMSGRKVHTAMQVATLFVTALNSIDGVTCKVYAHSGDISNGGDASVDIYRIWERGDPLTRLGLINHVGMGNNYDGHAIAWVARQMERDAQPGEQQMLLVMSDGYPSGQGYGSEPAFRHVRSVVERYHKREMHIIQIAIDPHMDENRQGQMFREYVPYGMSDTLDSIPARVAKILRRVL